MFVLEDFAGRAAPGQSSPLPPLAMPVHRQDGHQCGGRGGGYGDHAGWDGWEEWAMFCSEECRIHYECDRFFKSLWKILCRSMLICIYLDDRDLYDKLFILLNTMICKYDSFLNSLQLPSRMMRFRFPCICFQFLNTSYSSHLH